MFRIRIGDQSLDREHLRKQNTLTDDIDQIFYNAKQMKLEHYSIANTLISKAERWKVTGNYFARFPGTLLRSFTLCLILAAAAHLGIHCSLFESDSSSNDELLLGALILNSNSSVIYMFSDGNGDTGYNGNRSGRSGLDATCTARKQAAYSSLSCTNIRAFISVSSSDSISNMPSNYKVPESAKIQTHNGTLIASNWADLLDGSLSVTGNMRVSGLFEDVTANPPYFWTGSNSSSGSLTPATHCDGWTTSAAGQGSALDASSNSFTADDAQNCNSPTDGTTGGAISLLCLCF